MRKLFVGAAAVALGLSPVAWSSPADATAEVAGPVTGTMTYDGDGIPALQPLALYSQPCRETTFELTLQAVVAVHYGDLSWSGPVTITGNGRSGFSDDWRNCEAVWQLTGAHGGVFLTVEGTDEHGVELRCDHMYGLWMRQATTWYTDTGGPCSFGDVDFDDGEVIVVAEWAPTPVGGGVTTNVTGAVLAGVANVYAYDS